MANPNYSDSESLEKEFERYAAMANALKGGNEAMLAEIQSSLVSVKNITETLKTVNEISRQSENAELIRAISSLNLELAQAERSLALAIREATALETENIQLQEKIAKLENPANKEIFELVNGKYYRSSSNEPLCKICIDNNAGVYSLYKPLGNIGGYQCSKCGSNYGRDVRVTPRPK